MKKKTIHAVTTTPTIPFRQTSWSYVLEWIVKKNSSLNFSWADEQGMRHAKCGLISRVDTDDDFTVFTLNVCFYRELGSEDMGDEWSSCGADKIVVETRNLPVSISDAGVVRFENMGRTFTASINTITWFKLATCDLEPSN